MSSAQLYKLSKTPSGKALWTYMAAVLKATKMDKGQVYPLKKFLGNFKTHLDNNRVKLVEGGYQLTPKGIDYFQDRYNVASRQHINESEVEIMLKGILTGVGNDEWVALG
ncbi:hypothetical protein [Shewanella sp. CAL98-MNA-CIBAN-0140]|jgi:hypothetical protein|uniref:hypothetical protein n=1 Tax=unclassified Shewanella TaxID=196818 RepID=UPI00331CCB45